MAPRAGCRRLREAGGGAAGLRGGGAGPGRAGAPRGVVRGGSGASPPAARAKEFARGGGGGGRPATDRPLTHRARSARAPGARWATEDSAGPRPAPRAFGAPRRPARCACGNCPDQSLRGASERGPRGGRPLPVVGGGPPRMRGLYRYTLCKRKIQQRARTDRPLVAGCFTPLEGRAGRASAAGRPAGRRQSPGWDTRFPPRKVPALPDRWTGPGGTRTDEPREKAPSSSSAKSPQDPSRPGGRHHKHGRGTYHTSHGRVSIEKRSARISCPASFVSSIEGFALDARHVQR